MRHRLLAAIAACSVLPACFQLEASGQLGWSRMAVRGDIGYVNGASTVSVRQDVDSALGLGEDQDQPYARAMLDTGVQVIAVSAFRFEESGTGLLQADFGGVTAGTTVRSDFEFLNAKGSYAFEIALGPVSIAPGIAIDYFDLELDVRDLGGVASETLDVNAPVPLAFVRGTVDLGIASGVVELGYIEADIGDVDGSFFDAEILVEVRIAPLVHLFGGYRRIALDAEGVVDGDTYEADLEVDGFVIGGGVRF